MYVRIKDFCRGYRIVARNKSHGETTWKVMQRNAWKDIANLDANTQSRNTMHG